jgi:hypothetical protein
MAEEPMPQTSSQRLLISLSPVGSARAHTLEKWTHNGWRLCYTDPPKYLIL